MSHVGDISLYGQADTSSSENATGPTEDTSASAPSATQTKADELHKKYSKAFDNFPRNVLHFYRLLEKSQTLFMEQPSVSRTDAANELIADIEKSIATEREFAEKYRALLSDLNKDVAEYTIELNERLAVTATDFSSGASTADWMADKMLSSLKLQVEKKLLRAE